MDLNTQIRYKLIKDLPLKEGTIPIDSEITLFRGFVYLNGGMIMSPYDKMIMNVINSERKNEFFKEIQIIHNKI